MKIQVLKELIKEAVREAVREELSQILSEEVAPTTQVKKEVRYDNYKPAQVSEPRKYDNPLAEMLDMTSRSMMQQPQGRSNISSTISAPGLGMQPHLVEDYYHIPEPGIDLSQLDFVGKAAAVFKASVEKDKQRFGA